MARPARGGPLPRSSPGASQAIAQHDGPGAL